MTDGASGLAEPRDVGRRGGPGLLMAAAGIVTRTALILVVTSLIWLVAFPIGHWAIRPAANQAAALATLRSIAEAQGELRAMAAIDSDRDGIGEYGTFAEMAGGVPLRGSDGAATSRVLPAAFAQLLAGGVVERQGFFFRIDLPTSPRGGRARPAQSRESIDAALAEELWQA